LSLIHEIALTSINGIGDITAKILLNYCDSAENIFNTPKQLLIKIPGIGSKIADAIKQKKNFEEEEKQIQCIEKNQINPIFFTNPAYPKRLKHCLDAPIMLYSKGSANLNATKIISIVGTRNATEYGKQACNNLINDLKNWDNLLIVSGLAYGIDIHTHKLCLINNIPTVGVLAHGLDRIYPPQHTNIGEEMITQNGGGLLTEFQYGNKPEREYFPKRNRIIAGIADATIVIEAGEKGGALITADLANGYNRDVFAFPGRYNDDYSKGCHQLIQANKAALITKASDIAYFLGWETEHKFPEQLSLSLNLSREEEFILAIIKNKPLISIDELAHISKYTLSKIAPILLELEIRGVIQNRPGKIYQTN